MYQLVISSSFTSQVCTSMSRYDKVVSIHTMNSTMQQILRHSVPFLQLPDLNFAQTETLHHVLCIVHTTILLGAGQEIIWQCLHPRPQKISAGFRRPPPISCRLYSSLITTSLLQAGFSPSLHQKEAAAAAYRSRSACRPVSSACRLIVRQTVRWSFSAVWSSHRLNQLRREPLPSPLLCQETCASIRCSFLSSSSTSLQRTHTHSQDQGGGSGREGMERSDVGKKEEEDGRGVHQWEEEGGVR